MGCCECSQKDPGVSPIISNETLLFESILSTLPANCRQQLRNLPAQRFLVYYKLHLDAMHHTLQKEYLFALFNELIAIEEFKQMLSQHPDHFVFLDMYTVLSECFFAIKNLKQAAEAAEAVLTIMLKYMPNDYKNISLHYYRLAQIYTVLEKYQRTEYCLVKAIETGKMSNELPQTFIQALEQCLVPIRSNMANGTNSHPGEITDDFILR